MKRIYSSYALMLFFILGVFPLVLSQEKCILEIKGIPSIQGNLMIGMFNEATSFGEQGKQAKELVVKVTSTSQLVDVSSLVKGNAKVALAVYHDANENEKMDKNWLGVPTEYYGFSNDARGTFGPPSFEEAQLVISPNSNYWRIELK